MAHELPPLPYAYNALEPHIDEQTMKLHHDIHHKAYVDGLNATEAALAKARETGDYAGVKAATLNSAFHGSGHLLHCIFWTNMGPGKGGEPKGALADHIKRCFGSYDAFKKQFSAAAAQVEGSGWGILAYRKQDDCLIVLQAEKHQNCTQWGVSPVLVLDVWEHAYYLKYQNKRPAYVEAWWNVVNWDDVAKRYEAAKK